MIEVTKKWQSISMKKKSEIAKKYGYSTHRTIDAWVKKEEVGRLKLLELILKKELEND